MIKLASIIPHSPILIPSIGKKNYSILKKTQKSFQKIKEDIIKEDLDTIIIISPHQKKIKGVTINNHFQFKINFEEFGDYSSKTNFPGDLIMSYQLKELAEPDFWIELQAEETPDHGVTVPLYSLLTDDGQKIKEFKGRIIIINTASNKDLRYHFNLGQKLKLKLEKSSRKIGILASGELSHCLNHNAPGGFYQKAVWFDEKTIEHLKKGSAGIETFLETDPKIALEAKECGLRPIALLLGLLPADYKTETLSYQKELGVGYLSMKIN